ncbi:MAG: hypothetical protein HYS59_01510 [Candidatus Vogelbacteria bacterium]|nr:hypothetical protein [Candidatus Vogelbacteria bacterium]
MADNNYRGLVGTVLGIVAFSVVIGGVVAYRRSGISAEDENVPSSNASTGQTRNAQQRAILIVREFANGLHTYKGSITAPTPCHTLTHRLRQTQPTPVQVTIDFTITPPPDGTICTQVLADIPFEVSFPGPESALPALATLDGQPLLLIVGGKD